jgi:enolase-phosphatase E1
VSAGGAAGVEGSDGAREIQAPAAVVIDIEGTVGSIRFVKEVLFPFARQRLRSFVIEHGAEPAVAGVLRSVATECGLEVTDVDGLVTQLERWSDEDRKATPLKALQGMIWAGGYRRGELTAHLYDDAVAALKRWAVSRLPVHVYSSGSIAAQKLYFAHTPAGDLTSGLAGYFDTTTGPKQAPDSYRRIANAVGRPVGDLLFLSDVGAELEAAVAAGFRAVQVRREALLKDQFEPWIASFDELPF